MTVKLVIFAIIISSKIFPIYNVDNATFDFKKVTANKIVGHTFKIFNSGKAPMLIYSVSTSCGCTTTKYSKVIPPNKAGYIIINFDTRGNIGAVAKSIVVVANTKEEYHKLTIKGVVY